jgi:hypothetical protein
VPQNPSAEGPSKSLQRRFLILRDLSGTSRSLYRRLFLILRDLTWEVLPLLLRQNHSCFKFCQIFALGKDLEGDCSKNLGPPERDLAGTSFGEQACSRSLP